MDDQAHPGDSTDSIPAHRHRLRTWGQTSWDILRVMALIAVVIFLLYQVKLVVIPLMLGAFIASIGTPAVGWLDGRGLPRLLATWIVALGFAIVLFLLGWFLVAEVQGSAVEMSTALTEAWEQLQEWLASFQVFGGMSIPDLLGEMFANGGQGEGGLGERVTSGFSTATEAISGLFLTAAVAFFIVKDGERFWVWLLSKVPERDRESMATAGPAAWKTLRRYLFGTAVVGIVNATALAITLLILDVPLVIPLAILMFVGAFFPLVGAFVSGTIIALVTLATNGLADAVIVAIVVIVVQQLEGDLLAPLVLGRAVSLHPLLILFGITAGFVVGGIVGAFVTVPFIAITAEVVRTLRPEILQTE